VSAEASEARWVCPVCGSDAVEALAWVNVNTEAVVSWDECSTYWCPRCEEHHKRICQVDAAGRCLMHDQPFEACKAENRPPAPTSP